MFERTPNFENFIEPARKRPAVWRMLLGIIFTAACFLAATVGVLVLGERLEQPQDYLAWLDDFTAGKTRIGLSLFLLSFLGMIMALALVAPILHRRSPLSLIGPIPVAMRHFATAAGVYVAFWVISMIVASLFFDTLPNLPLTSVLAFLPVAAVLLLIQTGAEELAFRGYLMQQLAARFQSPWIWMALPSVVFGLIHYDDSLSPLMITLVLALLSLTGLLWADLVRITGNIGAAWGWHFANNFMLMNFVGAKDDLSGFVWMTAPFTLQEMPPQILLFDFCVMLATWAVLRRLLDKKTITSVARP